MRRPLNVTRNSFHHDTSARKSVINDTDEKSDLICLSSQSRDGGMCGHHGQLGRQSLKIPLGTVIDVWRQKPCVNEIDQPV